MPKGSVHVTVKLRGVKESLAALRMLPRYTNRGAERGMQAALEYLLKESQKITPIDKGTLRNSGKVIMTGKGKDVAGKIIYTAPHAVWVHECVTDHHEPPTQAKFLEAVMRDPIKQQIATRIMLSEIGREQAKTPGMRLVGSIKSVLASFFGGKG